MTLVIVRHHPLIAGSLYSQVRNEQLAEQVSAISFPISVLLFINKNEIVEVGEDTTFAFPPSLMFFTWSGPTLNATSISPFSSALICVFGSGIS